jgi:hypothetical protein
MVACLGNVFAEPVPSNDRGIHKYRLTDQWELFMKYAVEMGSGAMMRIASFINIGSGI